MCVYIFIVIDWQKKSISLTAEGKETISSENTRCTAWHWHIHYNDTPTPPPASPCNTPPNNTRPITTTSHQTLSNQAVHDNFKRWICVKGTTVNPYQSFPKEPLSWIIIWRAFHFSLFFSVLFISEQINPNLRLSLRKLKVFTVVEFKCMYAALSRRRACL